MSDEDAARPTLGGPGGFGVGRRRSNPVVGDENGDVVSWHVAPVPRLRPWTVSSAGLPGCTARGNTFSTCGRSLITSRYGRIRVLKRRKLENASCECYEVIRAHFRRLGL